MISLPPVIVPPHPIGVNVSPVEPSNLAIRNRMDSYLRQLGTPVSFRYGGGALADTYNWENNHDTYGCNQKGVQSNNWTPGSACARADDLSFTDFMADARKVGATGMIQADYGSGSPGMASSWASLINGAYKKTVIQVAIGNEPYGCAENNFPVTRPPQSFNYQPNHADAHCPYYALPTADQGMAILAQSFLTHAPQFVQAIRKADTAAKIVLPYVIPGFPTDSGITWDHLTMRGLKNYGSIDGLWYPNRSGAPHPDTQYVLDQVTSIPARAAIIKADLKNYAPRGTTFDIGEENYSNHATDAVCRPVIVPFAVGSALSWLNQGATTVDWWIEQDGNNSGGTCKADYSMFDKNGYPQGAYYGYWMAARLAQPGAKLTQVATGNRYLNEFRAELRDRHEAIMYLNLSATGSIRVIPPSGPLTVWQYSETTPRVLTSHVKNLNAVTTTKDSVTVIER